jgi:hypothetical protein
MRRRIISGIIASAFGLMAPQILQAQGTITYMSNLGQSSAGSLVAGSDSWLAAGFQTGTNNGGYVLNSIQLAMNGVLGNPSGFTVMLYADGVIVGGVIPGSSLGTLNGSLDPVASGTYTFTPAANLTLSRFTPYFIVLTAGTAISDGAYNWSLAGANSYNPSGGWGTLAAYWTSSNGSSWPRPTPGYPQFAINATAVPEPGVLSLLALGGFLLAWHRWKPKAV